MRILHIAVHSGWQTELSGGSGSNAGDTALNPIIQKLFLENIENIDFTNRQVWEFVKSEDILEWNQIYDYILIGGGGLLLNDQPGLDSSLSGWTWQISLNNLKKIEVPFIVYSLGFNKFFGGANFEKIFWESIYYIYKKSIFFSMRNTGSIEKIKEGFVLNNFKFNSKKFFLQPCLTQIYTNLFNEHQNGYFNISSDPPFKICLNLAFDRVSQRINYSSKLLNEKLYLTINSFLNDENNLIENLVLIKHKQIDELIDEYTSKLLIDHKNRFSILDISSFSTNHIYEIYRKFDFSIGMRGHGVMIPLGAGVLPYSLISHPKLIYLLEDLGIIDYKKVCFNIQNEFDPYLLKESFFEFIKLRNKYVFEFSKGLDYFVSITKKILNL